MKRILIVKMWALGDILVATPLLRALKRHYPDCAISWLVESSFSAAIDNNELVDSVIKIDWKGWQCNFRKGNVIKYLTEGFRIRKDLQRRKFDLLICLTPDKWWCLWFNTALASIALFPSNTPGFLSRFYTQSILREPGSSDHHIDRNLKPMSLLGSTIVHDRRIVYTVTSEDESEALNFFNKQPGFAAGTRYIVFHPGTSQLTKCWPPASFAKLAELLPDDIRVVVTGSNEDRKAAEQIRDLSKSKHTVIVAAGELRNFGASAALVKGAQAIVTGDTSMLHIASALNTPIVAIYGSTRPGEYAPQFGQNALLFDTSVTCAPCYSSSCSKKGGEHLMCLKNIEPITVYNRLVSIARIM